VAAVCTFRIEPYRSARQATCQRRCRRSARAPKARAPRAPCCRRTGDPLALGIECGRTLPSFSRTGRRNRVRPNSAIIDTERGKRRRPFSNHQLGGGDRRVSCPWLVDRTGFSDNLPLEGKIALGRGPERISARTTPAAKAHGQRQRAPLTVKVSASVLGKTVIRERPRIRRRRGRVANVPKLAECWALWSGLRVAVPRCDRPSSTPSTEGGSDDSSSPLTTAPCVGSRAA